MAGNKCQQCDHFKFRGLRTFDQLLLLRVIWRLLRNFEVGYLRHDDTRAVERQ
jgi:hypothetical protein